MGLLDDAIREHLELKRRRGADADEVARQEHEALGDPRMPEVAPGRGRRGRRDATDEPAAVAAGPDAGARSPSPAGRARAGCARRIRRPSRRVARGRARPAAPPAARAGAGAPGRAAGRRRARRGRARGDARVPPGDAGARPALVRAEAAARLRLRRLTGRRGRPPVHAARRLHRPRRSQGNALAVVHDADDVPDAGDARVRARDAAVGDLLRPVGLRSRRPTTATASG